MSDALHDPASPSKHIIVGASDNFWFWSRDSGWDLTHPTSREAEPFQSGLVLGCELSNVMIDPAKTALLIIDMQNFSMDTSISRDVPPRLTHAEDAIAELAIPGARKAGIQIIWLNWGLTEEECHQLPPGVLRVFGWAAHSDSNGPSSSTAVNGIGGRSPSAEWKHAGGLGKDLGEVTLDDGTKVAAGRALMRGTWNAAIHHTLMPAFEEGLKAPRPDILVHKNRNSGLWSHDSPLDQFLQREGIRTLLFTGMNTDQCVISTLLDAQAKSYDTIFLADGCATNSPEYAQQSAEFNCRRPLGFLSSCRALAYAAKGSE